MKILKTNLNKRFKIIYESFCYINTIPKINIYDKKNQCFNFSNCVLACSSQDNNITTLQPINKKAQWITNAFNNFSSGAYPQIKAVSWWHENFTGTYLRVDSSPQSIAAYREGVSSSVFISQAVFENEKLIPPSLNKVYHAAYPDFGGTEDIVTNECIYYSEDLVEKELTWAYFSNNWIDEISFPTENVNTILKSGKIPFIRLMAHSNFNEDQANPVYNMHRIIDGDFDAQLTIDAANTNTSLLAEFGTEVNGSWFPWNGVYNGATNITWFFHVDAEGQPDEDWNKIANYYPGDEYIDWVGASVYGAHFQEEDYIEFSDKFDMIYPQIIAMTNKPIAILEFAITEIE